MPASCDIKALASDTLTKSVPKVDKTDLIKTFIDSQKQHARTYATEGKHAFLNWKGGSGEDRSPSSSKSYRHTNPMLTGDGISSPVLRPRNAKCPGIIQPPARPSAKTCSGCKYEKKCNTESTQKLQSGSSSTKREPNPVTGGRPGTRKAKTPGKAERAECDQSDSAEEREMMLAQRRDKRRSKKEIVAPNFPDEDYNFDSAERPNSTRTSKGNKKSKLPVGIALMHGFSAKNIGKHRLTTSPTANFGVFNKGRASTKASTGKKRPVKTLVTFDEVDFLNKLANPISTQLNASKRALKRCVQPATNLPSKKRRKLTNCQDSRIAHGSAIASSSTSLAASSNPKTSMSDDKANYQSEVWEIEKEFLAASGVEDASISSISGKPGTVVLDTRDLNWDASPISGLIDKRASVLAATEKPENSPITSVATITPSQSVSQVAPRLISYNLRTSSSRSFQGPPDADRVSYTLQCNSELQSDTASRPLPISEGFQKSPRQMPIRVAGEDNQTEECNVTDETGCSVEDVIRKLENEEIEIHDLVLPRERYCLSVFSTDFALETDRVITCPDDAISTNHSASASSDARFTPLDEELRDLLYSRCNEARDNCKQGCHSDHDFAQYVERDTHDYDDYDYYVVDAGRNLVNPLFREAQMCEANFRRSSPGELAGEDYDGNDSEEYTVWQDESDGFEMSLASHDSQCHLRSEFNSALGEKWNPGSLTMQFLEGRFNSAAFRSDVSGHECDIDYVTPRKGFGALDTLEEAKAAVAQKFKKSFYPVKF